MKRQVMLFYLSSFLKNQTYFTPIFVLLLQFHHLSYQEIFWVFTAGAVTSFLLEIPSGVIADLSGKYRTLVFAKIIIFFSYLLFGFSHGFWMFLLAQVLYEFGNAFRSGTETAFVYDYLQEHKVASFTDVKAQQKVYARVGEGLATAVGGLLAALYGFNAVFFFAALPAFLNILVVSSFERITERRPRVNLSVVYDYALGPVKKIISTRVLLVIVINFTLLRAAVVAADTFIQPYMVQLGIAVSWIGLIYALALILAAFSVHYALSYEKKYGAPLIINILGVLLALLLLTLGFTPLTFFGVGLFFVLILFDNMRSPLLSNLFHEHVPAEYRATYASILEQFKSLGKIVLLPIIGYITDALSMHIALVCLGVVALIGTFFWVRK